MDDLELVPFCYLGDGPGGAGGDGGVEFNGDAVGLDGQMIEDAGERDGRIEIEGPGLAVDVQRKHLRIQASRLRFCPGLFCQAESVWSNLRVG